MKYIAMNNEARSHGKESTKPWKMKHGAMQNRAQRAKNRLKRTFFECRGIFFAKMFGRSKKTAYLCTAIQK